MTAVLLFEIIFLSNSEARLGHLLSLFGSAGAGC